MGFVVIAEARYEMPRFLGCLGLTQQQQAKVLADALLVETLQGKEAWGYQAPDAAQIRDIADDGWDEPKSEVERRVTVTLIDVWATIQRVNDKKGAAFLAFQNSVSHPDLIQKLCAPVTEAIAV